MKTSILLHVVLLLVYGSALSNSTDGKNKSTNPAGINISVNVRALYCNSTTEVGEDEVFFIVAGKGPSGEINSRVPTTGHFSVNDNGGNERQLLQNINLWSGSLEPGETVELQVLSMEEDASPNPEALKSISKAVSKSVDTKDPFVGTILTLAEFVANKWTNTHDWAGAFAFRITNDNGIIRASAVAKDAAKFTKLGPPGPKFDLEHDSARYDVHVSVLAGGKELKWDNNANGVSQ